MRILFIGAVKFSYHMLKAVIANGGNVVGVITKASPGINADHMDLGPLCQENSISVQHFTDINSDEAYEWIEGLKPDIILCFGWSSLIKRRLLEYPKKGVLGYHPAKLPMNRGRHPIIWALCLGLESTASTFFFMDEYADSGDILSQQEVLISELDDAETLYNKLIQTAEAQVMDFLGRLEDNSYERIPQDDSRANLWRKRGMEDGKIDFRMSSRSVYNLVRALTKPYVGAHFEYKGENYKVWKVTEVDGPVNLEPGKVIAIDEGKPVIKCGERAIRLEKYDDHSKLQVNDYL